MRNLARGFLALYATIIWPAAGEAIAEQSKERVVFTFPAALSDAARRRAESTIPNFHRKGFGRNAGPTTPVGPALVDEILLRTSYWVPYIVAEYQKLLPNYQVEVVPSFLDIKPDGGFVYINDIDKSARIHIDFSVFEGIAKEGAYSPDPTTVSKRLSSLFVVTVVGSGDQITSAASSGFLNDALPTSGIVLGDYIKAGEVGPSAKRLPANAIEFRHDKMSQDQWLAFIGQSPTSFADSQSFLVRQVTALAKSVDALAKGSAAFDDAQYARLLGVDYNKLTTAKQALLPAMRAAEERFVAKQSAAVLVYLHDSDQARATRGMMISEQEEIDRQFAGALTAAITGFASGASSVQMYSAAQSLSSRNNEAGRRRMEAFAPVMIQQVSVLRRDIGSEVSLTAESLTALRGKFQQILVR